MDVPFPLIACRECDLLQRRPRLAPRQEARCARCEGLLYRVMNDDLDRPLAYTLAAGILFVVANVFPIVSLELQGNRSTATLVGTSAALFHQDMHLLAVLVFITTVLVPALQLSAMSYLLVTLRAGRVPVHLAPALRLFHAIRPWGMVEVFMLGMLVSLVKLAGIASVVPGIGLWTFGGVLMMIAAALASFDPELVWQRQEVAA
jgi:paraquat-inducible protein A